MKIVNWCSVWGVIPTYPKVYSCATHYGRFHWDLSIYCQSANFRFFKAKGIKSVHNCVDVYIFLPLPKVTLSRRKIQTKNKQSHRTLQNYLIEHEIYLIFMLQNVSFDRRKSNECVHKAEFNNILSVIQLCIIKIWKISIR